MSGAAQPNGNAHLPFIGVVRTATWIYVIGPFIRRTSGLFDNPSRVSTSDHKCRHIVSDYTSSGDNATLLNSYARKYDTICPNPDVILNGHRICVTCRIDAILYCIERKVVTTPIHDLAVRGN